MNFKNKAINSFLTIIVAVNSFLFVLPILARAQSVDDQSIGQRITTDIQKSNSKKTKFILGLEELGFVVQGRNTNSKLSKDIVKNSKKKYINSISESRLIEIINDLNKLNGKSSVEQYLNQITPEEVLAVLATTIITDTVVLSETSKQLSNNTIDNIKQSSTNGLKSYSSLSGYSSCNEYRTTIAAEDSWGGTFPYYGSAATLTQTVIGCISDNKWIDVSIQNNTTTSSWYSWISNPQVEQYCYLRVSYPVSGNEYLCKSKASWNASGMSVFGVQFSSVWGTLSITGNFVKTWSWYYNKSVPYLYYNKSVTFCRNILGCSTVYK